MNTRVDPFESRESVLARIDSVLANDDLYEAGEPRPSLQTADLAKSLITEALDPERKLPRAEVSAYFGELDVTWKHKNRFLRLIVFPDVARRPVLYSRTDSDGAFTRGHSIEVTGNDIFLSQLDWLLGNSQHTQPIPA